MKFKRTIQKTKNIYHLGVALLANIWYRFPSRKLKVIGVTGTDGKTTTASLVFHILKSAGKRVSGITTVGAEIAGEIQDTGFHVTTPDPFPLQNILRKSVKNGDEFFVMEVTSHGLDQNRVWGISFFTGVITNITHEHLDYHGSYEAYVGAKSLLLLRSEHPFFNRDDKSYKPLTTILKKHQKKAETYGLSKKAGITFRPRESFFENLPEFQKYNYNAAYVACKQAGLTDEQIVRGMKSFKQPPGRMKTVYKKDFSVVIDFAHTPNGLEKWLSYLRSKMNSSCRLIHVFGSAAHRDVHKRPFMGAASGTYADIVILTEEDYRTENPEQICDHIAEGLKKKEFTKVFPNSLGQNKKEYTYIINRHDAITKAIQIAKRGDVITLTGKGHEQSLCRGKIEYPWNDETAVKEIVKELKVS